MKELMHVISWKTSFFLYGEVKSVYKENTFILFPHKYSLSGTFKKSHWTDLHCNKYNSINLTPIKIHPLDYKIITTMVTLQYNVLFLVSCLFIYTALLIHNPS